MDGKAIRVILLSLAYVFRKIVFIKAILTSKMSLVFSTILQNIFFQFCCYIYFSLSINNYTIIKKILIEDKLMFVIIYLLKANVLNVVLKKGFTYFFRCFSLNLQVNGHAINYEYSSFDCWIMDNVIETLLYKCKESFHISSEREEL